MYQHLPPQCVPSLLLGLIVNQSRSEALLISMYFIRACSSCGDGAERAGAQIDEVNKQSAGREVHGSPAGGHSRPLHWPSQQAQDPPLSTASATHPCPWAPPSLSAAGSSAPSPACWGPKTLPSPLPCRPSLLARPLDATDLHVRYPTRCSTVVSNQRLLNSQVLNSQTVQTTSVGAAAAATASRPPAPRPRVVAHAAMHT